MHTLLLLAALAQPVPPMVGPPAPMAIHFVRPPSAPPPARGLHPALKWGPLAANLLDAATTSRNLGRGGLEVNPLLRPLAGNDATLYASKAGWGIFSGLMADKLNRKGRHKAARIVAAVNIAFPLGAAGWNATR